MAERTEEEVATGLLRIALGGVTKEMPTLKARYVSEWGAKLNSDGAMKPIGEWNMADVADLAGNTVDRLLDLIVAYDRTAALGGREWLAENADPTELHAALVAMVGNAFPLADDPAVLVGLLLIQWVGPSVRPSSTNGASPNGTSTPTRSARVSTPSR